MPYLSEFKKLQWYEERPQHIKNMIDRFPYAATVRIKQTGQIAYVYSWFDDGTIKVVVTEEENKNFINALPGTYAVFGLKEDDIEFIHENPTIIIEDGTCEA